MQISVLTAEESWGGAELHTIELVRTLAARGHEVTVIQLGHNLYSRVDFSNYHQIKLVRLEISTPLVDLCLRDCFRAVRGLEGDVCLFPKGFFNAGSWRLDFAARAFFQRYITIEHLCAEPMPPKASSRHIGGLVPGVGLWWYSLLLERLLRSWGPYRVVCVSNAVMGQLADLYRFPPRKLKAIHNGIDPEKYRRQDDKRNELRTAWGMTDDVLVFGAMGRMFPQKGYDIAINLFAQVVREYPERDMRLIMAGEGPMLSTLELMAYEAGVEDRIIFAGFCERPWEVYSAFDVFLMPSRNEGLPLALLEAMASNCCPIAMGVGGIPEVIENNGLGWLVKPGDENGFLTAMRRVVQSSSARLAEIGREARKHVVTHFNAGVQFTVLAEFIEKTGQGSIQFDS